MRLNGLFNLVVRPLFLKMDVKLVIVGNHAVGKTCFLIILATKKFPGEYVPTVFNTYRSTIMCIYKMLKILLS